jgi:hypothetical protein
MPAAPSTRHTSPTLAINDQLNQRRRWAEGFFFLLGCRRDFAGDFFAFFAMGRSIEKSVGTL